MRCCSALQLTRPVACAAACCHSQYSGPEMRVGGRDGQQHARRVDHQRHQEADDQQHHPERHALVLLLALEAGVADPADHQQRAGDGQPDRDVAQIRRRCSRSRSSTRRSRSSAPAEDGLFKPMNQRLSTTPTWVLKRARRSAAQATYRKAAAQPILPASGPSARIADQRPVVHHQRRRHAEADQVGQRVVLDAEFAAGAGQAGDAAVHAIEHAGHEHRHAGVLEVAAGGGQDRVEAGEQAAGGQQVRQQVDVPAARRAERRRSGSMRASVAACRASCQPAGAG